MAMLSDCLRCLNHPNIFLWSWNMLGVETFFNMSRNIEDWTKMKVEEYSNKLYLGLHTVIAVQYFTEILNSTIFSWITKVK
jgi:hypothetical protein